MTVLIETYDPNKTYSGQRDFDCGHQDINRFVHGSLKQQVRKNLSKAYVLTDSSNKDRFIGFYTLGAYSIEAESLAALSKGSLPRAVPCLRLVMLGVDTAYQKKQLGSQLLAHAFDKMISVSNAAGVFGLYLDADTNAVGFYERHGFVLLTDRQDPNPTPMFLHIETAKNAVSAAQNSRQP